MIKRIKLVLKRIKSLVNRKISIIRLNEIFFNTNREFWKSYSSAKNCGKILVEISEKNPFEMDITMRIAKAIQNKYGYKIVVLYSGFFEFREPYSKLIKSYGVDSVIFLKRRILYVPFVVIFCIFRAVSIFRQLKTLEDIEKITVDNILVGDLIYDTYIRIDAKGYSPKIDTSLFIILVRSLIYTYIFYKNVDENTKYMVMIDKCYINHGIFSRIGVEKNIPVFLPTKNLKILNRTNIYLHTCHPEIPFSELEGEIKGINLDFEIEQYFNKRFSGDIDEIDVYAAYRNKKIYTRKEIINILDLKDNWKNIVIMPHALSDFPHISKGLYSDYFQWLINLLNLTRDVDDVNWLIKPHPTSYFFNEEGVVENIIKDLNLRNIKILPDDLSTASIRDIADVILTVTGTAGLEFSTFGIPVVNAGRGYYSGYGFNFEPDSIESYENAIRNVKDIEKLTVDDIYRAKVVLHYLFLRDTCFPHYLFENMGNVLSDYNTALKNIIKYNSENRIECNILNIETIKLI